MKQGSPKKRPAKSGVFEGIMSGAREALAYARGEADLPEYRVHIPEDMDVRSIRRATGLTQERFAKRYGFNLARLRDLEQGRTRPDSVVRAYLRVIEKNPKAVNEALAA